MSSDIHEIAIKDITISKQNVRLENATKDLDELAASIKRHGLLQPIALLGDYGKPPYELIIGQRRFLAHKRLGSKSIRSVFAGALTQEQATLRSLVENLQRVELNHADAAQAITKLYVQYRKDERKVQRETGLSIQRVRDYISIQAQASDTMKTKLAKRQVSLTDVKRALRAARGNIRKAEELLELMEKYPLNKHQKKRVVEYAEYNQKATAKKIIEEAMRPRVEESIIVSLPQAIREALEKAVKNLSKDAEEIVGDVLREWLDLQGFLK